MAVDTEAIERLIAKYESLSPRERHSHKEADTRSDFIDPLFHALGWNVYDRREVEREAATHTGLADYAFKIDGTTRFYLEAKPLNDDIHKEDYARKAITYAYNKGVAWAVLCNFGRLVVFDAQEEVRNGKPGYVLNLEYGDYVSHPELLALLTPEAIRGGQLSEHAVRIGVRRRPIPIEKRLYQSMRQWREDLFNDMSRALGWKKQAELQQGDEAIQRLLDRLIFLRNCEDRGIGEPGLRSLRNRLRLRERGVRVAESLVRLFNRAAATYDSELFETNALIDLFLKGLGTNVDETLERVVEGLYSVPKSYAAYDFSLIDADVLGQVYEQYLGHVAQRVMKLAKQPTLPGMPAPDISVEEKRQRRRERGIYYTPRWVVDYIVAQTVGRFLEERKADADAVANVKILDPACGSGSFLIRAYETLLEHHAARMGGPVGHLDRQTRERILRHNIFGVDLDPQAVEIARLNLLMRMVREEEELPPLRDNVRLANSLISGTDEELRRYFGDGWREKQPFDWERGFEEIMEAGGFDVVIGNPPYVRIQTLDREEVDFYNDKYEAATGNYDIYCLFVEKGLQLLKPGGRLGFIVPNKFFNAAYGKGLRKVLSEAKAVERIVDFGDAQVFDTGTNYTCLLFANKAQSERWTYLPAKDALLQNPESPELGPIEPRPLALPASALGSGPWVLTAATEANTLDKLKQNGVALQTLAKHIFQGIRTSANEVYVVGTTLQPSPTGTVAASSRSLGRTVVLDPELLRPLLRGEDIKRYRALSSDQAILIPYSVEPSGAQLIPASVMKERYPATWEYLESNREALQNRERSRMRHERWYGYIYPKNLEALGMPKILTPDIAPKAQFALDINGRFAFVSGYGIVLRDAKEEVLKYTLGLMNSKALDFFLRQVSTRLRGGFYRYFSQFVGQSPIAVPRGAGDIKIRDSIVALVEQMLELHERLAAKGETRDEERAQIEREIEQTDREIDALVYDLYGLTQEERAIVEREFAR